MKKKKLIILISIILLIIIITVICLNKRNNLEYETIKTQSTQLNVEYNEEELTGEWSEYIAKITLSDEKITIDGSGVKNDGDVLKITSAGTYYITGSISDISIEIEANKKDDVQLVLDNCSITSKKTSPINGITCNKLTITLADNSENTLTDSSTYTTFTDSENSEPDGTLFTKTDLIINGNGTLIINANYGDGIVSKDSLKIINANIKINSEDDGIRGKDYVAINNATIDITSKGDGVKSTNETDTSLGYIVIEGGKITISSKADGIQAETILNISSNAEINISTSGNVTSSSNTSNIGYGNKNITTNSNSSSDTSSKALKAGTEISIKNGAYNITSSDDSIHSNGSIVIDGGTFNLSSGDDGIHADTSIVINGGNINIIKSYEGIESSYIEINAGTINVVASDDGINIGGGNDNSSLNGRMGQNNFSSVKNTDLKLAINGGNIEVNATGDGLDSNGSIYINGGTVIVAGSTSSGNGALDYDSECIVTGGTLIAYGATGMWQNPSSSSTQYSVTFQYSGQSGSNIVLKDSSGNEIASVTAEKSYGAILISNSSIKKGETYTLYVNNSSVGSITVDNVVSTNGSTNGNGMQQINGGEKRKK